MRVVLDEINPDDLRVFYPENFKELERLGITKEYEFWKKYLIVAIDGVSIGRRSALNQKKYIAIAV